jgi:predicted 2-oxoglutarate/Fe(II)-dependent dioxygenase YbiX
MFKYTTLESFLTPSECEALVNYSLNNLELKKAFTTKINDDGRKSQIAFNDYRVDFPKIVEKLENKLIDTIKIKGHKLNFTETKYQFTEYKIGDYYNWHTDSNLDNETKDRYCSIVIQLVDGYGGGNLELMDDENIIKFKNGKGNLFVFLSNYLHRITTLESGIRYSLVGWFALKSIQNYKKSLM